VSGVEFAFGVFYAMIAGWMVGEALATAQQGHRGRAVAQFVIALVTCVVSVWFLRGTP
jgi:hypothetical protein